MIAYFDCFSGISGDMILGALIDAGVPTQQLRRRLSCIPLNGYKLEVKKVKRGGFRATKVDIEIKNPGPKAQGPEIRKWKDIKKIIKDSTLSKDIKERGLLIFKRLFQVEAKAHGKTMRDVHLHELGAIDCIIDIYGTLIGLDILGVETVYASPLNLGGGIIKTGHGILPVPAPATALLLQNIPVYSSGLSFELTTPTGAAIISSLTTEFGGMPNMCISSMGIGAGNKDFKEQPNVLRLFVGHKPVSECTGQSAGDRITIIETNIDDMNPQTYEYVMEKLFKAGAVDAFLTQIIMKKGRPGIKLTILCSEDKKEELIKIIFTETTTLGLRFYSVERRILQREIKPLNTRFGKVNVKISQFGKDMQKISPEYEDCKKIAKKHNIPLIDVIRMIETSAKRSG